MNPEQDGKADKPLKNPSDEPIEAYFESVLKQKDEEIARLKEENMILLRLSIKKSHELEELKQKIESRSRKDEKMIDAIDLSKVHFKK